MRRKPIRRLLQTVDATLAIPLAVVCAFGVIYLVTHPFPALLGGLYLEMGEQILANNWIPPTRISGFSSEGLPFVYPYLGLYVIAIFLNLGIPGPEILRIGAPVVMLGMAVVVYLLVDEVFDDRYAAGVAAATIGVHHFNMYYLGGSGVVRGLGFCFAIGSMLAAYRRFAVDTGHDARYTLIAAVAWGLAVLTHPVHAALGALGILLAWILWDTSPRGLLHGIGIAAGGLVIAAPWWGTVVSTFGLELLINGSGSHGGLDVFNVGTAASYFWYNQSQYLDVISVVSLLGGIVCIVKRRWRALLWVTVPVGLLARYELTLFPVSVLFGVGAVYLVRQLIVEASPALEWGGLSRSQAVVLVVLVVAVLPVTAGYAVGVGQASPLGRLASYTDAEDRDAFGWIRAETEPDSHIVVIGDGVAEWLPYMTDRTTVVNRFGVEWLGAREFQRHSRVQARLADCETAGCIRTTLRRQGFDERVDYVYVPRGVFVDDRSVAVIRPNLHESLANSTQFDPVYENEGVVIYRVTS